VQPAVQRIACSSAAAQKIKENRARKIMIWKKSHEELISMLG
jgi:hypothetical protein